MPDELDTVRKHVILQFLELFSLLLLEVKVQGLS